MAAEEELVSWLFMVYERTPLPSAVDCNRFPMNSCDEGSLVIFWAGSIYEGTPCLGMFLFRVLGTIQQVVLQIDEHLLRETSDSGSRFSHIKIHIYVYFHMAKKRADIVDGNNFHGQGQRSLMPAFLAASWVADPFLGPVSLGLGKAARKKQGGRGQIGFGLAMEFG